MNIYFDALAKPCRRNVDPLQFHKQDKSLRSPLQVVIKRMHVVIYSYVFVFSH